MENKEIKKHKLTSVKGPTGEIPYYISRFLDIAGEKFYIDGEKLEIIGIENKIKALKIISAEVLPLIEDEVLLDDDDSIIDITARLRLEIRCDKKKYTINSAKGKRQLEKDVKKFLDIDENDEESNKAEKYDVVFNGDDHYIVQVILLEKESRLQDSSEIKVLESPFYDLFWNKFMHRIITEGVCYSHGEVPVKLRDSLRDNLNKLASKTSVDYHPNSNDIVRDLVHPALYPYITKISKLKKGAKKPKDESDIAKADFWGRPYEKSKFQWLPTPFKITSDGHCSIEEYVNNLDRSIFPELYGNLEKLFEIFLPYFEGVWNYINSIKFYQGEDGDYLQMDFDMHEYNDSENKSFDDFNLEEPIPEKRKFEDLINRKEKVLHDRELQVIVKIVDYTLQPGQAYEGVWHAEGMSHENIVMTGIYFLDRDVDLEGGDLKFKRAFTDKERNIVLFTVPQERPIVFNEFANDGFVPLGHFPTEEGYMLVFPNCHIHKIGKLINKASNKSSSRRIIVFFVVNPDRKIISTREIAPQQDIISLKQAKQYRLELMAERKYDKEKLNVRDIELCEH